MVAELLRPAKARPGDRVAVLSPSFAAPGVAPAVHEQALRRLEELTGLVPVEYPTTRQVGADARARADDLNAAFGDPDIRAVLATIGGEDQITVIPHLDADLVRADPKPFLGYSDNTNLLSWLWTQGVAGFYGGSTQVQLGAGPGVDAVPPRVAAGRPAHRRAPRGASSPVSRRTSASTGPTRARSPSSASASPPSRGRGRVPPAPSPAAPGAAASRCSSGCSRPAASPATPAVLEGGVLLLETSEEVISSTEFGHVVRSLGERGLLAAATPCSSGGRPRRTSSTAAPSEQRAAHRAAQRDAAIEVVGRYNPEAVVCVGVPFGHTRPQWILPYGGEVTVDGAARRVWADYS